MNSTASAIPPSPEWTFSTDADLAPHTRTLRLESGERLFCEGERPQAIYLVRSGILKLTSSSTVGREVITELIFPGEVCDLLAALDGSAYTVTGSSLQGQGAEVEVVCLEHFQRAMDRRPALLERLVSAWRARMRFQREMMVAIAVERAETRAMRALFMLAEKLCTQSPKPCLTFANPLSRQEFAELIGTTLETAIRVLSRLKRSHVLSESGHQLTVLEPERYHDLCAA